MGSAKKHKKQKFKRREKYQEYSHDMDLAHFQWDCKWFNNNAAGLEELSDNMKESITASSDLDVVLNDGRQEIRKKHKSNKRKRSRKKDHKRLKEKNINQSENQFKSGTLRCSEISYGDINNFALITSQDSQSCLTFPNQGNTKLNEMISNGVNNASVLINAEMDSSQDSNSCIDDNSQPLPENVLYYAGMTTENSPSCRPVSKPIIPRQLRTTSQEAENPSQMSSAKGSHMNSTVTNPLKTSENSKTSHLTETGREPRSCVLKLKQQKSPLNKLLEHLLRILEKRDPYQFFAWPVTDDIAPGYSRIISKPMDFSTIRQKIEDNEYSTLIEFTDDFRLMCDNAIKYNHVDTVYHKAAKRLLQVGLKYLSPDSLMRNVKTLSVYMKELTVKELGFELSQNSGESNLGNYDQQHLTDSADEGTSTGAEEATSQIEEDEKCKSLQAKQEEKVRRQYLYTSDMTPNDASSQLNQEVNKHSLSTRKSHKIDFWRLNKDGSTSLNVLIKDENEGPEKVIDLGSLVGKLDKGTGQVHCYREDKRNEAKIVKPLYYGPYSSYAPMYDSRFATLNKKETQLIMQTYNETNNTENTVQLPDETSYANILANGLLLNVFTNRENATDQMEETTLKNYTENLTCKKDVIEADNAQIEREYEKYKNTRIDFNRLRTLRDLGIDVGFLDDIEKEMENFELTRRLQEHLGNNYYLIEKLRIMQHERLSQPLPPHLALVPHPSIEEIQLANQITQQLRDVAKKLSPSDVTDPYSLRKAMGVSFVGLPPFTSQNVHSNLPAFLQTTTTLPTHNYQVLGPADSTQQLIESNVQPSKDSSTISIDLNRDTLTTVICSNKNQHEFHNLTQPINNPKIEAATVNLEDKATAEQTL